MRCVLSFVVVLALTAVGLAGTVAEPEVLDRVQANSVLVQAGSSLGSGTLFTRKVGNDTITFVWTAAHVVEGFEKTNNDVHIVQEIAVDGRIIREEKLACKVVHYSDYKTSDDLAILEVRQKNWRPVDATTVFYDGEIPRIGTEVLHVGSLLGQKGTNSLTTGIVSQVGRVLAVTKECKESLLDQTDTAAFPGSSGGGVYDMEGRYIGMLTAGIVDAQGFHWFVPIRRLRDWAVKSRAEWALETKVPVPQFRGVQ